MTETVFTNTPDATEAAGRALAQSLMKSGRDSVTVALFGEMGVGKTAFVRGFCSALGVAGVKSPTYTVVNEYPAKPPVYHFDMYRITSEDDLYSIGFDDYLAKPGYRLIEWSENIESLLARDVCRVTISRTDAQNGRKIEIITKEETA